MQDEGNDEEFVLDNVPKVFLSTSKREKFQKFERIDEVGLEKYKNKEKFVQCNQMNGKNEVESGIKDRIGNVKGLKMLKKVNISANLRYFGIKRSFFLRFFNRARSKGKKAINKDTLNWVIMITRKETAALIKLEGVVGQLVKKHKMKYFLLISKKFSEKFLLAMLNLSKRRLLNIFFGILNQSYLTKIRNHHLQSSFSRRLKFLLISERSQITRYFNRLKPEKHLNPPTSPHSTLSSNIFSRSCMLILLTLLSSLILKLIFFNYPSSFKHIQ